MKNIQISISKGDFRQHEMTGFFLCLLLFVCCFFLLFFALQTTIRSKYMLLIRVVQSEWKM